MDSSLDLLAIAITFFAVRMAGVPADEEHPFGHDKVEGMAAIVQAMLICAAGGSIIYTAVRRIITGTTIELTEAGIEAMLVSIIAGIWISRLLLKISQTTDSIALEASARNITADIYSTAGVLVALIAIRFTGFSILDTIVALGVFLFILKAAYDVMKKSFGELADIRLPETEEAEIISSITVHSGQLVDFHAVRTRRAGSQRFIDLHLMLPKNTSLEEAHQMCDHLEQDIKDKLPNSSVTIHAEPCETECDQCLVSSCNIRLNVSLTTEN